jgi:hypothetical protein
VDSGAYTRTSTEPMLQPARSTRLETLNSSLTRLHRQRRCGRLRAKPAWDGGVVCAAGAFLKGAHVCVRVDRSQVMWAAVQALLLAARRG